ncbi:MAG TPA: glutathione S-transferase family protein [Stellaceae bacterium]|jgi:glutathione S-transferase|nr:glutathione S-transferase family protein [Stellaceae bacterium]
MLELYHSINSVCAQKVRIALHEKQIEAREHDMTLQGDQFDPAYLKLNPNAVVPTLVHDGRPVIESSVILYYLDEAFPQVPLMPTDPHDRATARLFNKLIDEYVHTACMTLSFATCFRARMAAMSEAAREEEFAKAPSQKRSDIKRDVTARGLQSHYAIEAVAAHEKLLAWMDEALARGEFLAGNAYSLADIGVLPYILRLELVKLERMWAQRPRVAAWWARVRARPSTQDTVVKRMTEKDWAPFKGIEPDPWPAVQSLLRAT